MADSVVSFVLDHLSQLVEHEARLLSGVEDKVKSLERELQMINVILRTTNSNNDIQKTVVSQIRDVAHEAEDVIDTYVAKVALHNRRTMLGRLLHGVDQTKLLHDVSEKIDEIITTLNQIRENKIKYSEFQERNHQSIAEEEEEEKERERLLHKLRRNVEEEHVVGFIRGSQAIIKLLKEGGSRRNVVSIIGMGGLGKTTLARKVYNDSKVKQGFSCCVWVYVSNECRAKELLLSLLKHLRPNLETELQEENNKGKKFTEEQDIFNLSVEELKKLVRQYLERKTRYLVVLDDLWKTQDWDEVQDAFPDNNRGNRILITSRLKEVALHTSLHPPYYLQFLSQEESWELFRRKVFRGEECPFELEPLGKQIVASCRGLPLSIVVLAGLLANKEKSHREWSKVVGHVNWYLTQDETQVKDILLKLSYDNLPRRLKPCFLYFGIFPEDFEIPVRPLLQQWVAEGFIQETRNRDPDDVAEDYLYELIDRSLVQVAAMKTSGGVKTCHIHDLLRDLCVSQSKGDKIFEVCSDNDIQILTKPRRLSFHCDMGHYISSSNKDHSCIRSLFFFGIYSNFTGNEWEWLFKGFKLVRVLELGKNHCAGKIPSNLGDFIHLRYLRIDSNFGIIIPTSILTLQNLQTVDLGNWFREIPICFPAQMWKLKHLRHLYGQGPVKLQGHYSGSNEVMWNLRTIFPIDIDTQTLSLMKKGSFPNLVKLGLSINSDRQGKWPKLLQSLQELSHLNILKICLRGDFDASIGTVSSIWRFGCEPQELLQSLGLLTHITTLKITNICSLMITVPPNVTKLTLRGISSITREGLNALRNHTKLQILSLYGDYGSNINLNCVVGGFPQLQVLQLKKFTSVNWKLGNGAMPRLHTLVIINCQSLDDLPNELWSLTAFRKLHVKQPSQPMLRMLRDLKIKDRVQVIVDDHDN